MRPGARRAAAVVLLLGALAGAAGAARRQLEAAGAADPQAELLYLPRGPYLRALALGHEELLADLLYIWSIQYYSTYDVAARHRYLEAVFGGAITELDPRYGEAYLVGSMIMSVEARRPDLARRLLDKGLAALPDDWEIGYWAGWEAYSAKDYAAARDYWVRAARAPGAPAYLERLAARVLERAGDRRAAFAEYVRLLETATDERTRRVVSGWLARLLAEDALEVTRAALARYREETGHCPTRLDALVAHGLLPTLPQGAGELRYDPRTCEVLPAPGRSFGGGS